MRLPGVAKPLAIAYGTAELPAMVASSRDYHARRAREHLPGELLPIVRANHFTVLDGLRQPDSVLTRAVLRLARTSARRHPIGAKLAWATICQVSPARRMVERRGAVPRMVPPCTVTSTVIA